jgi:hypothetical protein
VGNAVSFGDQVRITAEVYDVADGSKVGQARREGSADDVLRMSDGLAVDVIRALLGKQGGDLVSESQVASLSTSSIEALRDYLRGEALIRKGEFEQAASAYEAAVDRDSTFASAYYRLTQAYGWMEAGGSAAERAELALRALKENLPARDRLILQGEEALSRADAKGIPLMEDAVKRYPDDPDAWILLGEHYVHQGPRLNRTVDDTWRAFSTAAELDPTFSPTYIHYAQTAMRRGDVEGARTLIDKYLSLSVGTHQGLALSLGFDLQFGDAAARAAALAQVDTINSHTASDLLEGLAFTPAGYAARVDVAQRLWARTRSGGWAYRLFDGYLGQGRVAEARSLLEDRGQALTATDSYLLSLAGPGTPPETAGPQACNGGPSCLLIEGVTAIDAGDARRQRAVDVALAAAEADAQKRGNERWHASLGDAREALAAYGRWRGGDAGGALGAFFRIVGTPGAWGHMSAVLRLWAGQIQADMGRTADADATFQSLEYDTPFGWYGLLLRARLHKRAGDAAAAAEYRRFLDLWAQAPADHPYVVEAKGEV